MSSKGPPIAGGLRKHDCLGDNTLFDIAQYYVTHPHWRAASGLLKILPLKTNVLLEQRSLKSQLERAELRPGFEPIRTKISVSALFSMCGFALPDVQTFGSALDGEAVALLYNTETGTAQQTVRLFGVRAPDLDADRPNIDPGNFLALAETTQKPLTPFAGAIDLLIKFLLFDCIAYTVMVSPPPPTSKPIDWATPVTGHSAVVCASLHLPKPRV